MLAVRLRRRGMNMNWFSKFDTSSPIITATSHIASSHCNYKKEKLPKYCCVFHFGSALNYLENNYETSTIIEKTPNFLENRKVVRIKGISDVCFVQGCYSAPAAVDLLETLFALGVDTIISAGMCGGFSDKVQIGDVLIPNKILCEEGTSHHYHKNPKWIQPDKRLHLEAIAYFSKSQRVYNPRTVTTDAIYRQTVNKENNWRKKKCVGVDMESSAILSVSNYYKKSSVAILFVSDIHQNTEKDQVWDWNYDNVQKSKDKMINNCVNFCMQISQNNSHLVSSNKCNAESLP